MVTIDDVIWQYPAIVKTEIGKDKHCETMYVPIWLKTDWVNGKPLRRSRAVFEMYITDYVMNEDNMFSLIMADLPTMIAQDLAKPYMQALFH